MLFFVYDKTTNNHNFKTFQRSPAKGILRQEYFSIFEKRMAYLTTKKCKYGSNSKNGRKSFI